MTTAEDAAAAEAQAKADKDRADADKTAAEARTAEATARKAEADADKAEADAAKAASDARKGVLETDDYDGAPARAARDADERKKVSESDRDAATARRTQLAALIPDVSTVKASTVDVKDGPPLWSTLLLAAAVADAGEQVAQAVAAKLAATPAPRRVLVTTDTEFTTADSVYTDVRAGLDQLNSMADTVLAMTTGPDTVQTAGAALPDPVFDVVGAIAGALPAVLSLLSAQRVISSAAANPTDLAVAAAVAGGLPSEQTHVIYADFRLVPTGEVHRLFNSICLKRQQLATGKIDLLRRKQNALDAGTTAKALLTNLQAINAPNAAQTAQIATVKRDIAASAAAVERITPVADWTDSLLSAIDEFIRTVRTIPTGASRSPLATAALHEDLHDAAGPNELRITHALLVKGREGQMQQMVDNRPLWFQDKFSSVTEIGISYVLIDTATSHVAAAGSASAVRSAHGTVGEDLALP